MRRKWLVRAIGCLVMGAAVGRVPCEAAPLYAFTSDRDGELDIFVADEGGGVRNVTRVSFGDYPQYWGCATPAWSPDGTRIAFSFYMVIDERDEKELYVIDADGSNMTRLTYSPGYDWYPTWSPDGSRIAFCSKRDGNYEIYVMNADGSGQQNLTLSRGIDGHPVWSPDGTQIAFQSDRTGVFQIYLMSPDGFDVRAITGHGEYCGDPTWSPDGTRLAFRTYADIRIVELDGTEVARLDAGWVGYGDLAWSPDGRELAFDVAKEHPTTDIYTVSVKTGRVEPLVERAGADFALSWYRGGGSGTLVRPRSWGTVKRLVR